MYYVFVLVSYCLVINTSAFDCLETLISKLSCCLFRGILILLAIVPFQAVMSMYAGAKTVV